MAENLMAKQFRGGSKGFLESHYAVWPGGLGDHAPNVRATTVGNKNAMALLKTKSIHGNSSYNQLLIYLKKIQQKEENKERSFLTQELNRVAPELVDDNLQMAVKKAIDNGDFGIAYTLLLRRKDKLKQLKREIVKSQFKSPQKMANFYNAQFFKYLEKRLNGALDMTQGQLNQNINENVSIDDIVEDWIEEAIAGQSGVSQDSLQFISNITKNSLVNFFTNVGIPVSHNSNIFAIDYNSVGSSKPVREIAKKKRKSGGMGRTKKTRIADIVEAIQRGTYKGLSTELMAISEQGGKGTATFSVGNLTKEINNELTKSNYEVQQKADVFSIVAYQTSLDLAALSNDLYVAYAENAEDKIQSLLAEIDRTIGALDNIFAIETNVKGYLSYGNLQIEQSGSFALRMNNLMKMRNLFPAKTVDRLIFLLVNTFDECVASRKIPMLEQYFAATIAAWMWDDYDQFFDINEQSMLQRVRMFKSGSMYYSASQVMKQGIEDLEKNLLTESKNSFIDVNITPPTFNAESEYQSLVDTPSTALTTEMSEDEVQATLEKRWNHMRDLIMDQGQFDISLNQKKLDELLGNLKDYV